MAERPDTFNIDEYLRIHDTGRGGKNRAIDRLKDAPPLLPAEVAKQVVKELKLGPDERLSVRVFFGGMPLLGRLSEYPLKHLDLRGADLSRTHLSDELTRGNLLIDGATLMPEGGVSPDALARALSDAAKLLEKQQKAATPDVAAVEAGDHVSTAVGEEKKRV